jgi:hypothetical protein
VAETTGRTAGTSSNPPDASSTRPRRRLSIAAKSMRGCYVGYRIVVA